LIVDPDAVLTRSVALEPLQTISRRNLEVLQRVGRVQHPEPAQSRPLHVGPEALDTLAPVQAFGVAILEAFDHDA